MITLTQNPNFKKWFKICFGNNVVDEIEGKAKAIKRAKALGRENETPAWDCTENEPKRI